MSRRTELGDVEIEKGKREEACRTSSGSEGEKGFYLVVNTLLPRRTFKTLLRSSHSPDVFAPIDRRRRPSRSTSAVPSCVNTIVSLLISHGGREDLR